MRVLSALMNNSVSIVIRTKQQKFDSFWYSVLLSIVICNSPHFRLNRDAFQIESQSNSNVISYYSDEIVVI